ncbi:MULTISPECIES: histidine kinase dimerization/phospho-acceptor domain-containing protein [unclassified Nocardioides]|uniref:histidine kinase dimerization/phospho-acceptor domain-containing protein n=1 Tax=Nocardioides sp. URHA0032 TaxID=1380388 RepID=UPI0009DEA76F|nr:histidine kinase dimerization/phospho-acceptor domain-containing protein [Nocardioides sp. URHA0032]
MRAGESPRRSEVEPGHEQCRDASDSPAGRPDDHDLVLLAASINHQLRTPLTVVVGHSELLRGQIDELPADQRRSIRALDDAVQRLSAAVAGVCGELREASTRARE